VDGVANVKPRFTDPAVAAWHDAERGSGRSSAKPSSPSPRPAPVPFVELPPPPPRPAPATVAPAPGEPAIRTRGLSKAYAGRNVVDALTIDVPRGKVVGFVGPNGAGKTTTIRMLLGLIRPSAGDAAVLGVDIRHPTRYLPQVGALIEAPAFYPNLSAQRNLEVFCRLGGYDAARIPPLLAEVGLASHAKDLYKGFSLGMKQRLGIAAALLPDPELLVLDEPTNGLDPQGIHEVRDFLIRLARRGKTVFVSSHLLAEVQRMCEHVIMLRKGKLVFQGPMEELLDRGTGLTLAAQDPAQHPALARLCAAAGYKVSLTESGLVVHGARPDTGGALNKAAMQAGIVLRELHAGNNDLEDTFLQMTGLESTP
jgi:ABC-2 type transport system ATP-binding protein